MAESRVNLGAGAPEEDSFEIAEPRSFSFGIGDLLSKVVKEGLPANARALLESAGRRVLGLPPAKWGNEVYSPKQLEHIREIIKRRPPGKNLIEFGSYPDYPGKPSFKTYKGPGAETFGIGNLMQNVYNDDPIVGTSLGGFQVREDDKNYYISDPFDFSGVPEDAVKDTLEAETAYEALRSAALLVSPEAGTTSVEDGLYVRKPPPSPSVFELTIPKEGPISSGREPVVNSAVPPTGMAEGGEVEQPMGIEKSVTISKVVPYVDPRSAALGSRLLKQAGVPGDFASLMQSADPKVVKQVNRIMARGSTNEISSPSNGLGVFMQSVMQQS
jgi:hypothetical protein